MSDISHTLITGVTMTGKTTLGRTFSRGFRNKGQDVVVYDPMSTATAGGSWGDGAIIIADPIQFENYMERDDVSHAHIFVDEADEIFSHEKKHNHWMLKKGRHMGLSLYLMTQRPKMVAPTVRNMCANLYMFRLSTSDSKEICADFGHDFPAVLADENGDVKQLDTGDFLMIKSGSVDVQRANIFQLLEKAKT